MARLNRTKITLAAGAVQTVPGFDDDFVSFYRAGGEFLWGINGRSPTIWGAQGLTYQRGAGEPIRSLVIQNTQLVAIDILIISGTGAWIDSRGTQTQVDNGQAGVVVRDMMIGGATRAEIDLSTGSTSVTLVTAAANLRGIRVNRAFGMRGSGGGTRELVLGYNPTANGSGNTTGGQPIGYLSAGTAAVNFLPQIDVFDVRNVLIPAGMAFFYSYIATVTNDFRLRLDYDVL